MSQNGCGMPELIHHELKNGKFVFRLSREAKNVRHFGRLSVHKQ